MILIVQGLIIIITLEISSALERLLLGGELNATKQIFIVSSGGFGGLIIQLFYTSGFYWVISPIVLMPCSQIKI
jgi:hypothetical protein